MNYIQGKLQNKSKMKESRNFSREILDIMYQQLKVRKILKTNIFSKYGVYAIENQNYFRYSLDTFLKGV